MEIGIGLPNSVPGTTGAQLVEWARQAEASGFSSLGTIDRIAYPNYEPLVSLSAAAAVTERIKLATTVMLGPLRANAALVAKQVLSLDTLAGGGRAVLGIGIGDRDDDFEVSQVDKATRGQWMDTALEEITAIWNGTGDTEIGPRANGSGPSLIVGGAAEASFDRAARLSDGWIMGGGSPDDFAAGLSQLKAAWEKHGRDGSPRTMALAYFALGPDGERSATSYLNDYYEWLGKDISAMIAASAATDADTVRAYVAAFDAAGCDELIFTPASGDPAQVKLLADAIGLEAA
jgi:alkanesulfonate monooxygenase SsuD/methylene tetrahydromethanopterin reductase-like flavin-dependent oxidoreductase (luciferase family)